MFEKDLTLNTVALSPGGQERGANSHICFVASASPLPVSHRLVFVCSVGVAPSPRMTFGSSFSGEAEVRGEGAAPTENKRFPVVP